MPCFSWKILQSNEPCSESQCQAEAQTAKHYLGFEDAKLVNELKEVELVGELRHVVEGCQHGHVDARDTLVCNRHDDRVAGHKFKAGHQVAHNCHYSNMNVRPFRVLIDGRREGLE